MNDRNAFLQGQGSPIKDDAPPPEQGWRGEKSADEAVDESQRRTLPGSDVEVVDVSGVGFVEATGGQHVAPPKDDAPMATSEPHEGHSTREESRSEDGVSALDSSSASPGGESGGAPYPRPYQTERAKNDYGGRMGHGGQSGIAYHGPGHLGEQVVDDDKNRNGVAESND